jgi:plastocyanin
MPTLLSRTCAIALAGAGAAALPAHGGPEKVAYPSGYLKGERYGSVDRPDIKQYREFYAQAEVIDAVRKGKPIPSGAVITMVQWSVETDAQGNPIKGPDSRFVKKDIVGTTVMEKRSGWGGEYPDTMRNGEWEYAAFTADGRPNPKANANIKACFDCHKPHEKQDFVITLAKLGGTFPTAAAKPRVGATEVNIASFAFGPGKISVAPGQSVNWTNTDDSPHQISVAGRKTAVLLKGQSATLKFDQTGNFDYICSLHPTMKGQVEVRK